MLATQETTYVDTALSRLLEQYKGRPVLSGVLTCLVNAIQTFENIAYPVASGTQLANAVGVQLDHIGEVVGLPRNGLDDAQYTIFLLGSIAANNSKADNETLLRIIQACFEASEAQVIAPHSFGASKLKSSAAIGIEVGVPTVNPSLYALVLSLLKNSIAAGVQLSWVSTYAGADAFALAGSADGKGLGDANVAGSGGQLASNIYNNLVN